MAYLTPDKVFNACGVTVKEKIIPFGTTANKNIYVNGKLSLKKGQLYKADRLLETPGHRPAYITIHNTDDIKVSAKTTKAEQYARATHNQNMGMARVAYYVDAVEAWQTLLETEIGWHVDYGKAPDANNKSVSIEIIGNYKEAEDNGARLVAYLLNKYNLTIDKVRTHNSWSGKNCPCWILPHWDEFLENVQHYLSELKGETRVITTDINDVMFSLGIAAVRTGTSKTSPIITRVTKGKYYAFDEYIKTNNEEWLKHANQKAYSMLADGGALFKKYGEYDIYKTTATVNIRRSPSLSKNTVITALKPRTTLYIIKGNTVSAEGYVWQEILYNGDIAYIANKYIKKV